MDDDGTLRRSGIDFCAKSGHCRAAFGLLRLLNLRHNQFCLSKELFASVYLFLSPVIRKLDHFD